MYNVFEKKLYNATTTQTNGEKKTCQTVGFIVEHI